MYSFSILVLKLCLPIRDLLEWNYVMENASHKTNDVEVQNETEEIMAKVNGVHDKFGENDEATNNEVFCNKDNNSDKVSEKIA
ncbi:hypothetical protein Tco_0504100, partial [Tanacetum coccineum]